jgi:hypothetical protein
MNIHVEQYKEALSNVKTKALLKPEYLRMVQIQYELPSHKATAPQLADLLGVSQWGQVNLWYGRFGHILSDELQILPPTSEDRGKPEWWQIIAHGENTTKGFVWTLREPFIQALKENGMLSSTQGIKERQYWWFGVNNVKTRSAKAKSHVIYPEIEPVLSSKTETFAWPYGGKPLHHYTNMQVGDAVLVWMGDGSYTSDWGILGSGIIADIQYGEHIRDTQYFLKMQYVPSVPLTPYPHNYPRRTPETDFLYQTFGDNFCALQKLFYRLEYIEKPQNVATTITSVSSHQYEAVCSYFKRFPNILGHESSLRDSTSGTTFFDAIETIPEATPIQTVKERLQQTRIGQDRFRHSLIQLWNGRCAVTGFSDQRLLRASHIKPWRACNNQERLDPFNGLLLTPNLDAAFDQGLITFNTQGGIEIAKNFKAQALGITHMMSITLHTRHEKYFRYHRKHVYQGEKG